MFRKVILFGLISGSAITQADDFSSDRSMIQFYCSRTICLLALTMDRTPIP